MQAIKVGARCPPLTALLKIPATGSSSLEVPAEDYVDIVGHAGAVEAAGTRPH